MIVRYFATGGGFLGPGRRLLFFFFFFFFFSSPQVQGDEQPEDAKQHAEDAAADGLVAAQLGGAAAFGVEVPVVHEGEVLAGHDQGGDPGQQGDLLTPQTRDAAMPAEVRQPYLFRGQPGAAASQEVPDITLQLHSYDARTSHQR